RRSASPGRRPGAGDAAHAWRGRLAGQAGNPGTARCAAWHARPPAGNDRVKALISGGAGYIGSTVASACLDAGITPIIVDNLVTGRNQFAVDRVFYEGDIADARLIDRIFADH